MDLRAWRDGTDEDDGCCGVVLMRSVPGGNAASDLQPRVPTRPPARFDHRPRPPTMSNDTFLSTQNAAHASSAASRAQGFS